MLISGSCHCRNISFDLDWQPEPSEVPARACTCTFCSKHGAVWASCPTGSLRIRVKHAALESKYSFGTETAHFHVCMRCGGVPVATSEVEGRLYAVVNVNAFDDFDAALLRRGSSDVQGEDELTRLARRARNWIGRVEFVDCGD